MRLLSLLMLSLSLAGCATSVANIYRAQAARDAADRNNPVHTKYLTNPPLADFPQDLYVIKHVGIGTGALRTCNGKPSCALVDFCSKICRIYSQWEFTSITAQETKRCKGFDYPGEPEMRDQWEHYKSMDGHRLCRGKLGNEKFCETWPTECSETNG